MPSQSKRSARVSVGLIAIATFLATHFLENCHQPKVIAPVTITVPAVTAVPGADAGGAR